MPFAFFQISAANSDAVGEDLNRFIKSHSVVHIEKHFHSAEGEGFWSFCVEYRRIDGAPEVPAAAAGRVDYREVLPEEEFAAYSRLREVRKELANEARVPTYAVATNEQLAAIVRNRVRSKAGFHQIAGFGDARIQRFGDALLRAMNELLSTMERRVEKLAEADSDAEKSANQTA